MSKFYDEDDYVLEAKPKKSKLWKLIKIVVFIIAVKKITTMILEKKSESIKPGEDEQDLMKIEAHRCGKDEKIDEEFNGAEIIANSAGVKLDLSEAKIDKDVNVYINAKMSGVDIALPKNIKAELTNKTIIGGVSKTFTDSEEEDAPTVNFFVSGYMSGVSIR